jgi:hypothetical protein
MPAAMAVLCTTEFWPTPQCIGVDAQIIRPNSKVTLTQVKDLAGVS